ncbi:geranylgeranyl reductase family protein [Rhodococcus hoagii]|uniref:geranylgeranyl reductase family protein n=1 Tax=Rhodococcus hoagii TaxID=43767 RepID=UPI000A11D2D6|nr:geranylgeranyl reductase family protein [Prescottella equi]MBM4520885.1 geranylgeranyl reductase family protein [Prescottella equi]MBM4532315.1 geranylgeranyl reductase family protein [Prescottella equi]MBM4532664.1 geranylgeranyl reductase family protein [Prescottella equi]MBM4543518.1 geranylgeranyl reductase family protein [Prescottella equi]MBM4574517.1 geranylgeranyl reductase family protein [Prescottella equi]
MVAEHFPTAGSSDAPNPSAELPSSTEVLVVGAGPAGTAAATWAARAGRDVLLLDAATFPRDKTCGDGLTPRAVAELDHLGLGDWVRERTVNRGLRLTGWGRELELPWPGGALPAVGSAVPRTELDDRLRLTAVDAGARMVQGAKAVGVERDGDRVRAVTVKTASGTHTVTCEKLIVADGVRSTLGKQLGRQWHRGTAYGVAARAYATSGRSADPWITSHLELRDDTGALQPGYGWVFPLATGEVNIGVGTLATAKRPAPGALRPLLDLYVAQRRAEWRLDGDVHSVASALLPMGGAVSNVAGRNWALIGDAAACVNPLNGEGIDYGLEGGRLVARLLDDADLTDVWPAMLRDRYGRAFSIARRLAGLLTVARFLPTAGPVAMRSRAMMTVAVRVMGNLVTDEDADVVARAWRTSGAGSLRLDARPPFS